MVDARDLKSLGQSRAGSIPAERTIWYLLQAIEIRTAIDVNEKDVVALLSSMHTVNALTREIMTKIGIPTEE